MTTSNVFNIGQFTIDERISIIKKLGVPDDLTFYGNTEKWTARKSTVNSKVFANILRLNNWPIACFERSIDPGFEFPLSEEPEESPIEEAIRLIDNCFDSDDASSYAYLIRHFLHKFDQDISASRSNLHDKLSEKAKANIMECLANRLLSIAVKVFVLELNRMKQEGALSGDTAEARFESFIAIAGSKSNLKGLYCRYPAMTRKLVVATEYYTSFVNSFFEHLTETWSSIEDTFFHGARKLCIEELAMEQGDTHAKGKSVVVIRFNEGSIVYKPRNLKIERCFDRIVQYFNDSEMILDIKMPSSIYKNDFTLSEFIEQKPCVSKEEVERYYIRYGQLLAMMYLCNGSDMHYENIISNAEYPIAVDLETLFNTPTGYENDDLYDNRITTEIRTSVVSSIMLPQKTQLDAKGNSIDMSGLSGYGQTISKKDYIPKDLNTDNARFELGNVSIGESKNGVYYNDLRIDYSEYVGQIVDGFKRVMSCFLASKDDYIELVRSLPDYAIRLLFRDTGKYMQFLLFTRHPSCLVDFAEVEKVLENLYTHPVSNKRIAQLEYRDMLFDNVPIFYAHLDSRNVESSAGDIVKDALMSTPREAVIEKLQSISIENVEKQIGIVKMRTLGRKGMEINHELHHATIANTLDSLEFAESIAREMIESAYFNHDKATAQWLVVSQGVINDFDLGPAPCDYYNGLVGFAQLFKTLSRICENEEYNNLYNYISNSALGSLQVTAADSGFFGLHSLLRFADLIDEDDPCQESFMSYLASLDQYFPSYLDRATNADWLQGLSGVIPLYLRLFEIMGDDRYLSNAIAAAHRTLDLIDGSQTVGGNVGIGHGLSGHIVSLSKLYEATKNRIYLDRIEEFSMMCAETIQTGPDLPATWCNGTLGYLLGQHYVKKVTGSFPAPEIVPKLHRSLDDARFRTDCLCHGNCGRIQYYLDISKLDDNKLYSEKAERFCNELIRSDVQSGNIKIDHFTGITNYSLFTGLAGVALTVANSLHPAISLSPFI
ncbi:type 2 lanthipeptide synthetase LanM [Eggerthella timonensis]|uniref:type 2 lanthipeptide synthetase LanM n=1 Tax=Eggerthella timonensis TaxID=1871008 RepID=UPI000C76FF53|nr:type 2 lanthipeptide synthetase LanM [Eggerthella timonensis]